MGSVNTQLKMAQYMVATFTAYKWHETEGKKLLQRGVEEKK